MDVDNNTLVVLPEVVGKNVELYNKARELYSSLDGIMVKQKKTITAETSSAVRGIFVDMMIILAKVCNGDGNKGEDLEIKKCLGKVLKQHEILTGKIDEINKNKSHKTKSTQSLKPKDFENTENTIFIKAVDCNNSSETKEKLVKAITEKNIKVNIRTIRSAGKNVVVSLESAEEVNKLKDAIAENDSIKAEKIKKRPPKVIIFGIERNTKIEDFKNDIVDRNFLSTGMLKTKIMEEIKFKFPIGKREGKYLNWVVELPNILYWKAINKGRLYASLNSHRIEDFCQPKRCFRCFLFGHTTRFCKSEEIVCRHCAGKGHNAETCSKKNEKIICVNCIRVNKGVINSKVNHNVKDRKCPAYTRALEWERRGTDYSKDFSV